MPVGRNSLRISLRALKYPDRDEHPYLICTGASHGVSEWLFPVRPQARCVVLEWLRADSYGAGGRSSYTMEPMTTSVPRWEAPSTGYLPEKSPKCRDSAG